VISLLAGLDFVVLVFCLSQGGRLSSCRVISLLAGLDFVVLVFCLSQGGVQKIRPFLVHILLLAVIFLSPASDFLPGLRSVNP
jgi:hypothetical protein